MPWKASKGFFVMWFTQYPAITLSNTICPRFLYKARKWQVNPSVAAVPYQAYRQARSGL